MECQHCGYEGPRKEFKRNMIQVTTTASGMKTRTCPRCSQDSVFHMMQEREEDEKELKELVIQMDSDIKSGDINAPRLKKQLREVLVLNTFLNEPWVEKFSDFILEAIRSARANNASTPAE